MNVNFTVRINTLRVVLLSSSLSSSSPSSSIRRFQSIMRTGAPPAPPPGRLPAKLQSPLHRTTFGVVYSHIHRTLATPPPPAGTCALCQHFGVFYCGYKRVSPSEPLSNNTGPLC
ncbi:hypothetical protein QTP88_024315 [Uroleucon formosanum]